MKTITLRYGKETIDGRETFFSTASILRNAVNNVNPQQGGIPVEEMCKRLKLLEVLDKHPEMDSKDFKDELLSMEKEIQIEDADFEKLKSLFAEVKWMVVSKFIINIDKELKEAKTV